MAELSEAQKALLDAVVAVSKDVGAGGGGAHRAALLTAAAVAFRAAAGGAQVGGVFVEK